MAHRLARDCKKKVNLIYFCIEKKHENQTKILNAVNCLKLRLKNMGTISKLSIKRWTVIFK